MALWLPLMRGTLTKPAEQPISAPPGKASFGHRLPAALGDRPCAIGEPLAAFQQRADQRMGLEALELLERRQIRVGVVEVDDEADRHQIVAEVIEERAAAGAVVERPAEGMLHQAGPVLLRIDLPQLLEADAVFLRLAALAETEAGDELLGERAARAFADQRVFGAEFHAALEARLRRAVAADAHVAGRDADDRAAFVVQRLDGGEAREDLDAERLGLPASQRQTSPSEAT